MVNLKYMFKGCDGTHTSDQSYKRSVILNLGSRVILRKLISI